jgi:hypothetical protein
MKVVEKKLNGPTEEDVLTVWFNAWRYEREDQFAIVALLKTIAFDPARLFFSSSDRKKHLNISSSILGCCLSIF